MAINNVLNTNRKNRIMFKLTTSLSYIAKCSISLQYHSPFQASVEETMSDDKPVAAAEVKYDLTLGVSTVETNRDRDRERP